MITSYALVCNTIGYDGAPADNCDEQFCRYEVGGTFSFDQATQDFTEHEWGGTSYHSNLVAYGERSHEMCFYAPTYRCYLICNVILLGPLANVFVEGPIEEIAGPWALASNPNAPYDSHVVVPADPNVPLLRQLYYGGATENYIYTNASAAWGTELAHFRSDSPSDGDLEFPSDLWTLKVADSGNNGGKIVISSAHIEASIFHTAIGDAGMTECESESRDWLARAYHVHILTLFFLSTMNCNRLQQLRLPHSVRHRWYLGHRPSRV